MVERLESPSDLVETRSSGGATGRSAPVVSRSSDVSPGGKLRAYLFRTSRARWDLAQARAVTGTPVSDAPHLGEVSVPGSTHAATFEASDPPAIDGSVINTSATDVNPSGFVVQVASGECPSNDMRRSRSLSRRREESASSPSPSRERSKSVRSIKSRKA